MRSTYTSPRIFVVTFSTIFFLGYSITFFDLTRVVEVFFYWLTGL